MMQNAALCDAIAIIPAVFMYFESYISWKLYLTCKTFWDYINNGLMKQIPKEFSFNKTELLCQTFSSTFVCYFSVLFSSLWLHVYIPQVELLICSATPDPGLGLLEQTNSTTFRAENIRYHMSYTNMHIGVVCFPHCIRTEWSAKWSVRK